MKIPRRKNALTLRGIQIQAICRQASTIVYGERFISLASIQKVMTLHTELRAMLHANAEHCGINSSCNHDRQVSILEKNVYTK